MKRTLILVFAVLFSLVGGAQDKRKSPAMEASKSIKGNVITVKYSAPSVNGRAIYGELVPFDQVWRTGANEATTLTFTKDVTIAGKQVKAGSYALFTIPGKEEWVVILNSDFKQWGAYNYDKAKDVLRFSVEPYDNIELTEQLKFDITDEGVVTFAWEGKGFSFKID